MENFIKKSIALGVGAYSKAQKELEKHIKTLVKKNKVSKKEGEEMLKKFLASSKQTQKKVESQVRKDVSSLVKKVTLAKQRDLLALTRRVKALEAKPKTKKKASQKRKKSK